MARRPNHTSYNDETTGVSNIRCLRSARVRAISGVRGASGRRPGGVWEPVREAPGTCPKSVRNVSERRPWPNRACESNKRPNRARLSDFFVQNCQITISFRRLSLRRVFDGRRDGFARFSKTTRLCRKFKNAAPVHKNWRRSVQKCAFRSSFESELCVFAVPVQ